MIPPSIVFIIYGIISEESITKLFIAGVFPGLLLAGLYSSYIITRSMITPNVAPRMQETFDPEALHTMHIPAHADPDP